MFSWDNFLTKYGRSHAAHFERGILTKPTFCNMKCNYITAVERL